MALPLQLHDQDGTRDAYAASLAYGALPERLVILQGGTVEWIGGKGPEEYSIQEGRQALSALLAV